MDNISKARRSANMARIRGKDSVPELFVRCLIHKMGYRFRLHRRDLPGTPDIVFPGRRKVIFVHGCFWHRHSDCRKSYMPKSRVDFWQQKFSENKARDIRALKALKALNWSVLVVWECEAREDAMLENRITQFLEQENFPHEA